MFLNYVLFQKSRSKYLKRSSVCSILRIRHSFRMKLYSISWLLCSLLRRSAVDNSAVNWCQLRRVSIGWEHHSCFNQLYQKPFVFVYISVMVYVLLLKIIIFHCNVKHFCFKNRFLINILYHRWRYELCGKSLNNQ